MCVCLCDNSLCIKQNNNKPNDAIYEIYCHLRYY